MVEGRRDITRLLASLGDGDGGWSQLLPLVYEELRALALARLSRLRPGRTIQATDLVHEAYRKLAREDHSAWEHRGQFFAVASLAMRDVLVDEARKRGRLRRGGDRKRVTLSEELVGVEDRNSDLLALDEALQRLEAANPRGYRIVLLKYFGGLEGEAIARALAISPSTVDRQWRFARAWLHREMERSGDGRA
jgi:RNA polymerase sigma factor (TIGR02999 family)